MIRQTIYFYCIIDAKDNENYNDYNKGCYNNVSTELLHMLYNQSKEYYYYFYVKQSLERVK